MSTLPVFVVCQRVAPDVAGANAARRAPRHRGICYFRVDRRAQRDMVLPPAGIVKLRAALGRVCLPRSVLSPSAREFTSAEAAAARVCLLRFADVVADPNNAVYAPDPTMYDGPRAFNLCIALCLPKPLELQVHPSGGDIDALCAIFAGDGDQKMSTDDFLRVLANPECAATAAQIAAVALVAALGHLVSANRLPVDDTSCVPCMAMFHGTSSDAMLNLLACAEAAIHSDPRDHRWLVRSVRAHRATAPAVVAVADVDDDTDDDDDRPLQPAMSLPPWLSPVPPPVDLAPLPSMADAAADAIRTTIVQYTADGRTIKRARVVVLIDNLDLDPPAFAPPSGLVRPIPVRPPRQ